MFVPRAGGCNPQGLKALPLLFLLVEIHKLVFPRDNIWRSLLPSLVAVVCAMCCTTICMACPLVLTLVTLGESDGPDTAAGRHAQPAFGENETLSGLRK